MTTPFREKLKQKVFLNLNNNLTDNADRYRTPARSAPGRLHDSIRTLGRGLYRRLAGYDASFVANTFDHLDQVSDSLAYLYSVLEDDGSKELLVEIGAFRILGNTRFRLPLSTPDYWHGIERVEELAQTSDPIIPGFESYVLYKHNLAALGYPIELYFNSQGIFTDFVLKQYQYQGQKVQLKANAGDYVIDGGGCWGDTALFFADSIGETGKVFSFEFIPENLKLMNMNLALNFTLKQRIEVVEKALSSESGKDVYYVDNGPASTIVDGEIEASTGTTKTLSIDDLVSTRGLDRVDFIKLDIEGAELTALQGAKSTIKRFRPTLAVALYHNLQDFLDIPKFISELDAGYHFYLGHYTIHHEETILFATSNASAALH